MLVWVFIPYVVAAASKARTLDDDLQLISEAACAASSKPGHALEECLELIDTMRERYSRSAIEETSSKARDFVEILDVFDDELTEVYRDIQREDIMIMRRAEAVYSPRFFRKAADTLRSRGRKDDSVADVLLSTNEIPALLDAWKLKAYSIEDLDDKLLIVDEIMSDVADGCSLDQEAAIACLSIWRLQLIGDSKAFKEINEFILKYAHVVLEQRKRLLVSEVGSSSREHSRDSERKLIASAQKVYEDSRVAYLVASLSYFIFTETGDFITKAEAGAFERAQSNRRELELGALRQLLKVSVQRNLESTAVSRVKLIASLKSLILGPDLVSEWIEQMNSFRNVPAVSEHCTTLLSLFRDADRLVELQRSIHDVSDLRAKLKNITTYPDFAASHESSLLTALLGNLAMWMIKIRQVTPRNAEEVELMELSLQAVLERAVEYQEQRRSLSLIDFKHKSSEDLGHQVKNFFRKFRSPKSFRDLYLTLEEADAVSRVSAYLSVLQGTRGSHGKLDDDSVKRLLETCLI